MNRKQVKKKFAPTKTQVSELIESYDSGTPLIELADRHKVSTTTMRTCLKKHGVIFSDKGKNPNSIKNLDLGKFKPGQSGNPAGRPKGYASLSERLKLLLEKSVGDIITESEKTVILKNQGKGFLELSIADAIVKTAVRESLKGDFKFIDMLWQRIDGKVAERIAGHDGGPLQTDSPAVNILAKAAGNPKLAKSIIELANACEDES